MKHELSKPICERLGNRGAMWMVTFAIVLIAATILISGDYEACCFYNKSYGKIHISFNCGWFCGNVWTLEPGNTSAGREKEGLRTSGASEVLISAIYLLKSMAGLTSPMPILQVVRVEWKAKMPMVSSSTNAISIGISLSRTAARRPEYTDCCGDGHEA